MMAMKWLHARDAGVLFAYASCLLTLIYAVAHTGLPMAAPQLLTAWQRPCLRSPRPTCRLS